MCEEDFVKQHVDMASLLCGAGNERRRPLGIFNMDIGQGQRCKDCEINLQQESAYDFRYHVFHTVRSINPKLIFRKKPDLAQVYLYYIL